VIAVLDDVIAPAPKQSVRHCAHVLRARPVANVPVPSTDVPLIRAAFGDGGRRRDAPAIPLV